MPYDIGTSPYKFQTLTYGTYFVINQDLLSFAQSASGRYVSPSPGKYTLRRMVLSNAPETFTLYGPLAVLGVGSTSGPRSGTVTFSPRLGVKVVFSRTRAATLQQPTTLWTSTTLYFLSKNVPITPEAADELATFVVDADEVLETDAADPAEYEYARWHAEVLVDDAIFEARLEGRSIVVVDDIARARKRLCPVFPFCKKHR
jgi:hypothetical protein